MAMIGAVKWGASDPFAQPYADACKRGACACVERDEAVQQPRDELSGAEAAQAVAKGIAQQNKHEKKKEDRLDVL
jgi:hypothetical protein